MLYLEECSSRKKRYIIERFKILAVADKLLLIMAIPSRRAVCCVVYSRITCERLCPSREGVESCLDLGLRISALAASVHPCVRPNGIISATRDGCLGISFAHKESNETAIAFFFS